MNWALIVGGFVVAAIVLFVIVEHVKKALMTGLMVTVGVLIVLAIFGLTYGDTVTGWISAWPF